MTWQGLPYTAEEVRAFCASRTTKAGISSPWPDITTEGSPVEVQKFVEWANGPGASTLSAYFVAASK